MPALQRWRSWRKAGWQSWKLSLLSSRQMSRRSKEPVHLLLWNQCGGRGEFWSHMPLLSSQVKGLPVGMQEEVVLPTCEARGNSEMAKEHQSARLQAQEASLDLNDMLLAAVRPTSVAEVA
jgi:hypothetical protein